MPYWHPINTTIVSMLIGLRQLQSNFSKDSSSSSSSSMQNGTIRTLGVPGIIISYFSKLSEHIWIIYILDLFLNWTDMIIILL